MTASTPRPVKIILAEFNEITWRFIEPLTKKGKLPTFAEFMREGTTGSPIASEVSPNLDPWISWTTVYTGRPQEEHGVRFLEQPPETVKGPRVWEIAAEAGKSIGVFGSIMSWPPRDDIQGFWVPSTFSPDTQTYPSDLAPIQDLNLTYTRAHSPTAKKASALPIKLIGQLLSLGLKPSTLAGIASFFVRSRINRNRAWEKVSLQPIVNLDFFEALYRRHRPNFATFHTNHVAHYMHRYWRAADPTPFPTKPSIDEVNRFGDAVEFGYQVADRVLRRIWNLADERTIVVVASGLGQQPYVDENFTAGREVVRVRDIDQILGLLGVKGRCKAISMMAPQWNLQFDDSTAEDLAEKHLASAWYRDSGTRLFSYERVGNTINFNVFQKNLKPLDLDARCGLPWLNKELPLRDLCAVQDATPKQGYHDPVGVLLMRGAGIRRGAKIGECNNLDIAPTLLHLAGVDVPPYMTGRVLEEALTESEYRERVAAMPN